MLAIPAICSCIQPFQTTFSHSSHFQPFQYFQLFLTVSSHFLQFPVDQSYLAIPRHSSYFKLCQAFSSHFKPLWPFQPCSAISSILKLSPVWSKFGIVQLCLALGDSSNQMLSQNISHLVVWWSVWFFKILTHPFDSPISSSQILQILLFRQPTPELGPLQAEF